MEVGETTSQAARREAFEETGVIGIVKKDVFGAFTYNKGGPDRFHVSVHLLLTNEVADIFPEKHIRSTRWVPLQTARMDAGYSELRELFDRLLQETDDIPPRS
jgi:8-oxo-dGTP pyrophosphatase MutT (NUDIX family)